MGSIEYCLGKCRERKGSVVFSDAEDIRVVQAAARLLQEGLIDPILIGRPEIIRDIMIKNGVTGVPLAVVNPHVQSLRERNAADYCQIQQAKGKNPTQEECLKAVEDPLIVGALMVYRQEVEIGVSGNLATTANVIRSGLRVLGTAPGIKNVSSVFYMLKGEITYVYSDCGVIPDPTAEQLVDITLSASQAFRFVDSDTPRIAVLSFSTKGSANHPRIDKLRQAVEMLHTRVPDLIVDGELQYDAAVVPEVAKRKAPNSPVKGRANVFIFPSLEAGNIAYKVTQYMGGFTALGPMLQGFSRGWFDLSRGCSSEDIYQVAVVGLTMSRGELRTK